jgi:hypothetical protein
MHNGCIFIRPEGGGVLNVMIKFNLVYYHKFKFNLKLKTCIILSLQFISVEMHNSCIFIRPGGRGGGGEHDDQIQSTVLP